MFPGAVQLATPKRKSNAISKKPLSSILKACVRKVTQFRNLPLTPLTSTSPRRLHVGGYMSLIPTFRCRSMRQSLAFYTSILDFERVDGDDEPDDPSFSVLAREGGHLFLSSHGGDGVFGSVVAVTTNDIDALFRAFRAR